MYHHSTHSKTPFFVLQYFLLFKLSLLKQAAVSLSFLSCTIESFQIGCCVFIPAFTFPAVSVLPSSKRSVIFLEPFFLIKTFFYLLYIKPLVSININSSVIDSFLDWEGHHCNFFLSPSSLHRSQFPPLI